MKAIKARAVRVPLKVDEQSLRRLDEIVAPFGPRTYAIRRRDEVILDCGHLDALLEESKDERGGPIMEIEVTAGDGEGESEAQKLVTLNLRNAPKKEKELSPSFEYTLQGDRVLVREASDRLEAWARNVSPMYAPAIALMPWVTLASFCAGFCLFFMVLAALPPSTDSIRKALAEGKPVPVTQLAPSWAWMLAIVTLPLGWTMGRVLPIADFSIGSGITQSQKLSWLRNTIFVAFGLGVVASVIANRFG